MDLWVKRNLQYLEDAVGTPQFKEDVAGPRASATGTSASGGAMRLRTP